MEDSERTRRAGLALLQAQWPFQFLEKNGQRHGMKQFARELGWELREPSFSRKENLMFWLFGRRTGKRVIDTFRKIKLAVAVNYDEIMFKISEP